MDVMEHEVRFGLLLDTHNRVVQGSIKYSQLDKLREEW
jgi:hypothetical protein